MASSGRGSIAEGGVRWCGTTYPRLPMTEPSTPANATDNAAETVSRRDIDRVNVGTLRLERGGIGEATADRVELKMGGIGRLQAEDVFVQFGGVGLGRADKLNVEWGSVGAAAAGELHVQQGIASNVIAREATLDQGLVRTLIAAHVTVTRPSAALVVIAGKVDGEVRALLDWRGALAFGLGFGLIAALGRLVRKAH
jgi:hypothetical protein